MPLRFKLINYVNCSHTLRIGALEMTVCCSYSLGEILSKKCDAETVQEVTNDEKRLLHLRTGHNVADICTLSLLMDPNKVL